MTRVAKENRFKFIKGIIITFLIIILLAIFLTKNQQKPLSENANMTSAKITKPYHSDLLEITFNIPSDYVFKEENPLREVVIEKNGHYVKLHRFGTNRVFKNIQEFLDDIDKYENQKVERIRKQININGKECLVSTYNYPDNPKLNNKTYDCFIDSNSFLSISTTSKELYPDLDQIAQSFRYEP